MNVAKTTWRQKCVSLLLAFVLGFGLSPFGTATPAYADPSENTQENALYAAEQNGDNSTSNASDALNADSSTAGESNASSANEAAVNTGAQASAVATVKGSENADGNGDDATTLPKLTIKGLHSAQINSGKLYTYTDDVRGGVDLLEQITTTADGTGLMYENINLAAGDYWFEAYDENNYDNGGIKITVSDAEAQTITLHRVYEMHATNSGWIKDTDYEIQPVVKSPDGTQRVVTIGQANPRSDSVYPSMLFMDGDSIEVTFTPLGEKAQTYLPTTVTKTASQTNTNIAITASIPAVVDISVTAPENSTISLGDYSGYIYKFYDAETTTNNADSVVVTFKVPGTITGKRFIRVQNPNGVTYWNYQQITSSQDIEVTAEDLCLNSDTFTKSTVKRFDSSVYDVGNIYMNISGSGYMNMNVGATYDLNMFRNWQAIESFMNSQIALPDMHYKVVDFNGNASDVVSIEPSANNSSFATMTAKHEGTAVVLVTYDAMTFTQGQGGAQFSAIWPELTGVFVVSVGADGTAIKTNMTMDRFTSATTNLDSEHDTLYYLGNEGASYTFTPEEGCTVSIARATVGNDLSYNGFSTEGVSVDATTGAVTVSKLTAGRHIIKVEKGGVATYQIINARQASVELQDKEGSPLSDGSQIKAGDTVTLQFSNLLNPCEKLAGIYNRNTKLTYTGTDGSVFNSNAGGSFGVYDFSGNPERQKISITIPKYWNEDIYTLATGVLQSSGWGGQPGDHRGLSYLTGKAAQMSAPAVGGVLSALPNVSLNIAESEFIMGSFTFKDEAGNSIDRNDLTIVVKDADGNTSVVANDGTFPATEGEFTYTTYAAGYKYQTGTVTITNEGTNAFTVTLVKSSESAWDGLTTTEPEQDEDDTYLISTGNELAWFALQNQNNVSASGKLMADIDLAEYPWINAKTTNSSVVTNLDGAGHSITGLNATSGLLGSVGNTSGVKNLSVSGSILGTSNACGGIVGVANGADTIIENCKSYVNFRESTQAAGGIVGTLNNATVQNCANYGSVVGSGSAVGGIVGAVSGTAQINACVNAGSVQGGAYTGGVLGNCSSAATVTSCYNTGTVKATGAAGGIAGYFSGEGAASLTDCYNTGMVTGESVSAGAFGSFSQDKASAARVYYLEGCASSDSVAQMLTSVQLTQPKMTLASDGFALTCDGYPRLTWEDANFHDLGQATQVIDATCTTDGYSKYVCSKCNAAVSANYVDALGHEFCGHSENVEDCENCVYLPPTCTQTGSVVQICLRDNCYGTHVVSIPATGHTENAEKTVEHEDDGYRSCVCATCGTSYATGLGTILTYVELPVQGMKTVSESLDESYPWVYNAETGQIESQNVGVNSSTATASLTFEFSVPTTVSFNYGVSSEANYDKFSIEQTVNEQTTKLVDAISGEKTDALTVSFDANKEYTLTFKFSKDGYTADGQDKAWISQMKIADVTPVTVDAVTLDTKASVMAPGDKAILNASVTPASAAGVVVAWASDNEEVASVVNGVVVAKSKGVARIIATAGNKLAICTVTVLDQNSKGDVNNNGKVNIVDAQIIYDLTNGIYGDTYDTYPLPENWSKDTLFWAADVNNDKAIDAADAFAVQYFVCYGSFGA